MAEQAERVGSMSQVGRIAGVFWRPRPVFVDLADYLKKGEGVKLKERYLP